MNWRAAGPDPIVVAGVAVGLLEVAWPLGPLFRP